MSTPIKIAELRCAQSQVEPLTYAAPIVLAAFPALLRLAVAAIEHIEATVAANDADEECRQALEEHAEVSYDRLCAAAAVFDFDSGGPSIGTNDGGMLRRCGTMSACKKIHGAASDYGHRPVGTLSDYLGVGTGVLVSEWHVVIGDRAPLPALSWREVARKTA